MKIKARLKKNECLGGYSFSGSPSELKPWAVNEYAVKEIKQKT